MALIAYLDRLRQGEGVLRQLAAELTLAGVARPLLGTDPGVVAAGLHEPVLAALPRPRAAGSCFECLRRWSSLSVT